MARRFGLGKFKNVFGAIVGVGVKVAKNTPQGQVLMKGVATAKTLRRATSDPKNILKPPERKSADTDTLQGLYSFHSDGDVLLKTDGETYVWVRTDHVAFGGNWVHTSAIEIE